MISKTILCSVEVLVLELIKIFIKVKLFKVQPTPMKLKFRTDLFYIGWK